MKKTVSADLASTRCGPIIRSRPRVSSKLPALMVLALLQVLSAHAQPPPVLQRGYDANVSGATLSETTLNTSNVVPGSFGLAFTLAVDDSIMAQPLYVPNVMINGTSHNVVYVATMSDTLYAFDADVSGPPLWQFNLASFENATPVPMAQFAFSGNQNIIGNLGILSTPVIDPSTNTLYAVACTLENGTMVYRLHAVDITTGTPRTGSGVLISGTYSTMTFAARTQWQRLSLVLSGNNVVFGFGALELESTANLFSGWVMAYDKSTLAQTGILATVTTGNGGAGVWQSGRPPAVDSSGYVYIFTGNGYAGSGYDGVHNFPESVLKLNPANSLGLVDWFTPSNWAALDGNDIDLASAGALLVPGSSLLVGGGKAGVLYVLNTGGLGENTANDSGAIQEITLSTGSMRGGPVYWQRSAANGGPLLYDWGSGDQLKAFAFNGSTFATTPSALGGFTKNYPGGILTLSANGSTPGTGVLWATVSTSGNAFSQTTPGTLYAFDAGNVATQLWNSNMNAADSLGNFAKFVPPLVANGRVYVATASQRVDVYGLLPRAAAPTFAPAAGSYSGAQSVQLFSTTPGASFYYTTDGTTPTTASTPYNGSIPVSSSMTIEAIATASGFSPSSVSSATYTITSATTAEVSLVSSANVDAIVNNGSAVPNGGLDNHGYAYSATLLGPSLSWNGNPYLFGAVGSVDAVSNTTVALPAGNYTTLSFLGAGVNGNQRNQVFTVNYSDGTSTSFTQSLSDWIAPQNYPGETKALTMAGQVTPSGALVHRTCYLYGYVFALNPAKTPVSLTLPPNRNVVVLAVDVGSGPPPAAAPTFSPAPGTYYAAQSVTLADATAGATIYYTTNGTTPSVSSTLYTGPITVSSSVTIEALAVASGYSSSPVASGAYVINAPQAAAPTFSPAPGTYSTAQSVMLADATPGASIYYTTNGTTPSVSSTLYTGPITVSSSVAIEAIAAASGYSSSPIASGTYVINTGSATVVPLSTSATVDGIAVTGSPVPNGGLDNSGYAYSTTLLGPSLSWNGNTYSFGSADIPDAVSNTTLSLPAGNYTTLSLLGTGVNGSRANQVFTVTYTDGTSTSFTQGVSDWIAPQNYAGETKALTMAGQVTPSGALNHRTCYLYGYAFALNPAKTVASLSLPKTRNIIVLAADLH